MLIVAGLATFIALIAGRYGTPFVVASKFGWGGLVFLLGRFAVVAVHELAHGLTMASFGRRIERAGLKAIFDLPVRVRGHLARRGSSRGGGGSRSRPRGRSRTSRSAPCSRCARCCCPRASVRDIFFNLAFAAYVGGFFNLNPFIERDGYHMLVDALNEPGLRRRAKEQLERRLRGEGAPTRLAGARALLAVGRRLAVVLAACFAIAMTLRFKDDRSWRCCPSRSSTA